MPLLGRPLFIVPRSRSEMFRRLKIKMPTKHFQTVCMVKTGLDAEANSNVQYISWHFSEVVVRFRKAEAHTNAPQRHNTLQTHGDRGARGSNGSCSAKGPGDCRIFANYCCSVRVRAGANLRPSLETTSGEEIPCLDLSLRSGRNTPLFGGFSDLGNFQNQHSSPHAVYTDLTIGESCIDQDLQPTPGYHKQWPYLSWLSDMIGFTTYAIFTRGFRRVMGSFTLRHSATANPEVNIFRTKLL